MSQSEHTVSAILNHPSPWPSPLEGRGDVRMSRVHGSALKGEMNMGSKDP
jgi:hypothetical protein